MKCLESDRFHKPSVWVAYHVGQLAYISEVILALTTWKGSVRWNWIEKVEIQIHFALEYYLTDYISIIKKNDLFTFKG